MRKIIIFKASLSQDQKQLFARSSKDAGEFIASQPFSDIGLSKEDEGSERGETTTK